MMPSFIHLFSFTFLVCGGKRDVFYTMFLNEELRGAPRERECSHRCPAFHDSRRLSAVSIETQASESWLLNFNDLWQRRGLMKPWQSQHTPAKTHENIRSYPTGNEGEDGGVSHEPTPGRGRTVSKEGDIVLMRP